MFQNLSTAIIQLLIKKKKKKNPENLQFKMKTYNKKDHKVSNLSFYFRGGGRVGTEQRKKGRDCDQSATDILFVFISNTPNVGDV